MCCLLYTSENFKRSILVEKEQRFRILPIGDEVVELISMSEYYYVHPIGVDYVKEVETHIEDVIEPVSYTHLCVLESISFRGNVNVKIGSSGMLFQSISSSTT